MKPFTMITALALLVVAAAHVYRIYAGLDVTFGAHVIPMTASYAGAAVAALLGIMVFIKSRR